MFKVNNKDNLLLNLLLLTLLLFAFIVNFEHAIVGCDGSNPYLLGFLLFYTENH